MFDLTKLYLDEDFNDTLVMMANKKSIVEFDYFRQDVFLEILDTGCKSKKACERAANRVAKRYWDARQDLDIQTMSYVNENGEIESADETMSRLVYHGKGKYV